MNLERHHRRIRVKARVTHWSLAPLALIALPLAIYLASGVCEEADSAASFDACRALQALPFLPALMGATMLALIAWDLTEVGLELHGEKLGERPARSLHHIAHGYRAIDDRHRRHVHWVAIHVLVVTLAIAAWLSYQAYVSTH